jgi:hypothetical protein
MNDGAVGPAMVCGDASTYRDGVVATMGAGPSGDQWLKPGETVVFGLVPDGITSVEMHLTDGTTRVLPVEDNAFYGTVIGQTAGVDYLDAGGVRHDLGGRSWDGIDNHA